MRASSSERINSRYTYAAIWRNKYTVSQIAKLVMHIAVLVLVYPHGLEHVASSKVEMHAIGLYTTSNENAMFNDQVVT